MVDMMTREVQIVEVADVLRRRESFVEEVERLFVMSGAGEGQDREFLKNSLRKERSQKSSGAPRALVERDTKVQPRPQHAQGISGRVKGRPYARPI